MLYLHIPFCKSFCTYCDFYSELCSGQESARVQKLFVDSVCREIDERRAEMEAAGKPRTLYVGGGTPSVLDVDLLRRIVEHIGPAEYDEFTVEVNPEDIVSKGEAYVRALLDMGVNRISMGVQSFDDAILRWMNRRHNVSRAREAYRVLRSAGVANISIDLIFGLSQLDDEAWEGTVREALELAPEHISAYQLSIEEGSALARMVADGRYEEASDERCRRQYDILCRCLADAGYRHYEISNFARPGCEALHNSAYWRRLPYVGLGPGAHSFDGSSRRWNGESPHGYGFESEQLSSEDERVERIMLALRTADGMPQDELRGLCEAPALDSLMADGSLVPEGSRIRIPEDHFFVSDDIIRMLV